MDAVLAQVGTPVAQVQQHVDEFKPTELAVVATAESGVGALEPSPLQIDPIHAP